jgi:hypothetical protein
MSEIVEEFVEIEKTLLQLRSEPVELNSFAPEVSQRLQKNTGNSHS